MQNANSEENKEVKVSQQWKICSKDKFWWIMIIFFLLYQLGGMLKNCSQLYYCNAIWGANATTITELNDLGGAKSGLLAIIGAIPTAAGMLVVWPLSNKIGKGRLILFGAILAVAGGILGLFAGDNFVLAVIAFVIKALGGAPAMYISLALLADISDHQEAKHGIRCDGLSMAIYGAIMVGMTGIANGIISGVLNAAGYDAANPIPLLAVQSMTSQNVQTAMTWIFFGGEAICFAIIALMFIFMNVEKHSKEDQEILKQRKEAAGVKEEQPEEAKAE
jgi:GPH family glycoside/pentoside/hexuronide:cation symporter